MLKGKTKTMEFSSIKGNLEADSVIGLILPTYCEAADIEKSVEEIERLNLNMPMLVIDDSSRGEQRMLFEDCRRSTRTFSLSSDPRKPGLEQP